MTTTRVDRAALVRRAMVELVAENGLHGTSMSQVAARAGVATGTAYVHYQSKEDLLVAAFSEVKHHLGQAAVSKVDMSAGARQVFESVWRNAHAHLAGDSAIARFLVQVEVSPIRYAAHEALVGKDPLSETARTLAAHLVELPLGVLYDLGLAPAVRLAASGVVLSERELDVLVEACWRAVRK
jgi:TetR/AcrR family transcriptional repressor of multidrug resistance operon